MAFHPVSNLEKPLPRVALSEWKYQYECLQNVARARLADTYAMRKTVRTMYNETRIENRWATHDSSEALTDRVWELEHWRSIICKVGECIDSEIKLLANEKKLTELDLNAMQGPIANVGDLLSQRDKRMGSELTYDDVDKEIKNELTILEKNHKLLVNSCQKAWEKLNILENVRHQINGELEDKLDAIGVDRAQLVLDHNSSIISNKLDCMHISKANNSYSQWLEHTKNIREMAENEMADAMALRESLFVGREKAILMLQSQQDRTDLVIRKRIFDTQRARNDLEFTEHKMRTEMKVVLNDISDLESALKENSKSLKLAETRLENRKMRRNIEECSDKAHELLCLEVEKQTDIHRALLKKIEDARTNFNLLDIHIQRLTADLEKKDHTLVTDKQLLEIRQAFKAKLMGNQVFNPCLQMDHNVPQVISDRLPSHDPDDLDCSAYP